MAVPLLNSRIHSSRGFPGGPIVKNTLADRETQVRSLGEEDPQEEEMATHSSILAGEFHGQRSLAGYSPWGCKSVEQNWTCMLPSPSKHTLTLFLPVRIRHLKLCLLSGLPTIICLFKAASLNIDESVKEERKGRQITRPYLGLIVESSSLCGIWKRISQTLMSENFVFMRGKALHLFYDLIKKGMEEWKEIPHIFQTSFCTH